jgi:hypothetical protein
MWSQAIVAQHCLPTVTGDRSCTNAMQGSIVAKMRQTDIHGHNSGTVRKQRHLIPGRAGIFRFVVVSRLALRPTVNSGCSFHEVKRPEHGADHSPPSSAGVCLHSPITPSWRGSSSQEGHGRLLSLDLERRPTNVLNSMRGCWGHLNVLNIVKLFRILSTQTLGWAWPFFLYSDPLKCVYFLKQDTGLLENISNANGIICVKFVNFLIMNHRSKANSYWSTCPYSVDYTCQDLRHARKIMSVQYIACWWCNTTRHKRVWDLRR